MTPTPGDYEPAFASRLVATVDPTQPSWDRFALAHKVRSFHPGSDMPEDTPEELQKLNEKYELDKIKPPKKKTAARKTARKTTARKKR